MKRGTWLQARREELKHANPNNASAYTLRGVAQHVGVTHAALSHLERADAMPTLELAFKLADYYAKTPEWVLTGKDATSEHGIPIVGTTITGPGNDFLTNGLDQSKDHQFVDMATDKGRNLYALRIAENCASPAYRTGDVVIVDAAGRAMPGEEHLVKLRRDDNFIEVLTMINKREDGIVFYSVTDPHNRLTYSEEDILFMHPILAVAKAWTVKKV